MRHSGKIISGAVMTILLAGLPLSGCSGTAEPEMLDYSGGAAVGMPNPFTSYQSVAEGERVVGFPVSRNFVPPASWQGQTPLVQVLDSYPDRKKMLQLIYVDAEKRNLYVRYSKQFTSREMNGDYNEYPVEKDIPLNGDTAHIRGTKEGFFTAEFSCRGIAITVLSDLPLQGKDIAGICSGM
jgi:hypothetical protein